MKIARILLLALTLTMTATTLAQPPKRRAEALQKQQQTATPQGSAYRQFPTAQAMPEDVAWRRDLYRKIDITKDPNAALYYPTTPVDGKQNLFAYLFKLILKGQIKAYDYKLDGNEKFTADNIVKGRELMDRYHIFYEEKNGALRVNDADLPSEEVKAFFIKESTYYDQHTATFRSQVTALCPVLMRGDSDFGGEMAQYPMCWIKMSDAAPYLGKLMLMSSSLNNAATLSADDFFTMKRYEGEVYKTVNLQDKLLANYCDDDAALKKEQQKIEKQLTDLQEHVWGRDSAYYARLKADSLAQAQADSLAAAGQKTKTARRTTTTSRRTTTKTKSSSVKQTTSTGSSRKKSSATKTPKQKATRTKSSSSGGKLSVRRQRH